MKTILVGIDFSKSTSNTINYALEIAKKTKSKILLFHSLVAPIIHTTSGLIFIDEKNPINESEKKMEEIKLKLSKQHPNIKINCEFSYTGIKSSIKKLAENKKISLVILGLENKNKITQLINGSTNIDLAGKVDCPVITVSGKYKKHSISKMLVAVDCKESIKSGLSKRIHQLIKFLNVDNEFVHIKTEDELNLSSSKKYPFKLTTIMASSFKDGISAYAKKTNADIIMLISNKHNALHSLFIENNSKKIILSSQIPVISIHK